MRDIMQKFIEHKCTFTGDEDEDHLFTIEMPDPFKDLSLEEEGWVEDGQITLDK
jgi:hypothetical protein